MQYIQEKFDKINNEFIDRCKNNLLTKNDLKLLNLFFNETPTQDKLNQFLSTYDIEVAGGYKALMLSYFMKMHPELNFTNHETPRLKGLFNFYRFQNMKLISYFMKIGKIFNENDIPILVLKGFAMKCLRPDLSRAMGDIDILVPENKFIKAIEICKKLGYRLDIYVHSIDVHEPSSNAGIMDIHRFIDLKNRRGRLLNKFLFKRAKKCTYSGIDILVPSYEDLLFMSLINLTKNLREKTSKASTLYVLFDCDYLLKEKNLDFEVVIKNIKLTRTENEIAFALKFINSIVPGLIPEQLVEHKMLKGKEYYVTSDILFNRYFFALQRKARSIKLNNLNNTKLNFVYYIKVKLIYKFCKYVWRHNIQTLKLQIMQKRERDRMCL